MGQFDMYFVEYERQTKLNLDTVIRRGSRTKEEMKHLFRLTLESVASASEAGSFSRASDHGSYLPDVNEDGDEYDDDDDDAST